MTADFWASQHYKRWIVDRKVVEDAQQKDKQHITELELKKLRIYFVNWLSLLGHRLGLRQRVVATALLYFKRFYLKFNFVEVEPGLVCGTSLYLASKVEECTLRGKSAKPKLPPNPYRKSNNPT
eukprot:TRINITY_DN22278_c0_g1_i1.p1 TRINITY_DN22278_c0_g1~~TRINITY_DN22278_c0_g1_i1.p1  ORF type:complete len:124 (+),score=17.37 TRINITY_DN22278_c0_g1_i1:93-464(+)